MKNPLFKSVLDSSRMKYHCLLIFIFSLTYPNFFEGLLIRIFLFSKSMTLPFIVEFSLFTSNLKSRSTTSETFFKQFYFKK